ncbi:DAK2 domain-containing protein [Petrotoga sp. SL27]|uniref:DAK2 domain-containing protein n=1 Tax=Petrotoga sp. SL27 TaxID=1445612 RepID=UPI000747966F|nr:DAK2 domain-containing protein [Petrotoga sp. SL27]KUK81646.1 MAG: Dak phosphatase [Petrotoga mobilis]POZ90713.1 Dak phosphatase [Petrotoga sp. SL27]
MLKFLYAKDLYLALKKGTEELAKNKDEINALNVFPVPDGDTGNNMLAGMLEACKSMDEVEDKNDMKSLMESLRRGLLLGARGNSGVILSQIFRGITEILEKKKRINTQDFIKALQNAKDRAYNAVMKPVEGTMLTLIRRLSEKMEESMSEEKDFLVFFDAIVKYSFEIVEETPKYLKKLRESNVVDAGAKGLAYILKGMNDALHGDTEVELEALESATPEQITEIAYEELTYQYCTEAIVKFHKHPIQKKALEEIRSFLESMGDSIVLVNQEDILKTHVHTNHPGLVFEKFLEHGELIKTKIDNMKSQHEHIIEKQKEGKIADIEQTKVAINNNLNNKNWGVIAVSPGKGILEIFKSLGVDQVIFGGQTTNPSVKDISEAINKVPQKKVIILPNNPNIILAAEKAAELTDKEILILPTKHVQEGISAMLGFDDNMDKELLKESMMGYVKSIVPIEVTYAVRDSTIKGEKIKKGEYLIFLGKELKAHGKNVYKETEKVLEELIKKGYEIITIIYGEGAKKEKIDQLVKNLTQKYANIEIEIHNGGQRHYPLLISVE